jgi:hypothetical protein
VAPRVSLSRTPTQEAYFSKLCKRFGATAAGREQPSTTPASATEPQEVRTPMRERERERERASSPAPRLRPPRSRKRCAPP